MAKKRRTGLNRRNFVAIPWSMSAALTTLGDGIVSKNNLFDTAFGEDIFILSIDCTILLRDLTSGQVPIEVGFAHGDLSITEIGEYLDAELTDPDDIIAKERSRRPVRRIGTFGREGTHLDLNDGVSLRVKIKFSVGNGFQMLLWVRNQSGAVLTTGTVVEGFGVLFGRWQR